MPVYLRVYLAVLVVILLPSIGFASNSVFMLLGDLPSRDVSQALGVSADGTVVVGSIEGASGTEAFRWTEQDGLVGLGFLDGANPTSVANAISDDGSTIVGWSNTSETTTSAFRWTSGGMVSIGPINGRANAVSANGSVIVGETQIHFDAHTENDAFIWRMGEGEIPIAGIPVTAIASYARGVSADGTKVTGWYTESGSVAGLQTAYQWEEPTGVVELPLAIPEIPYQAAVDISADGNTIVGGVAGIMRSLRWRDGQAELLEDKSSQAIAVSGDGNWAIGYIISTVGLGVIWDNDGNARGLRDILVNDCGIDLTDYGLHNASFLEPKAISADGTVIVGNAWRGSNLDDTVAFVINLNAIPEPSSLLLMVSVLLCSPWRNRR